MLNWILGSAQTELSVESCFLILSPTSRLSQGESDTLFSVIAFPDLARGELEISRLNVAYPTHSNIHLILREVSLGLLDNSECQGTNPRANQKLPEIVSELLMDQVTGYADCKAMYLHPRGIMWAQN